MNPLEQVNSYLHRLEARLRWTAFSRGTAYTAMAALFTTVILVLIINFFAFSPGSLRVARLLLFLSLAFAFSFGLIVPLLRMNRGKAARLAERSVPEFKERLLTFAEKHPQQDPFLELLAADTMMVADAAAPRTIVRDRWIFGSLSAAAIAGLTLIWLIVAGPGYMGHGASLLWAGTPRSGMNTAFYDIVVTPGSRTVRRKSDQLVAAQLVGFEARKVSLFAKYSGTSKWEEVAMQPQPAGTAREFLFAGLPETVEYYVEANGVRSKNYTFTVIDLPAIKKVKVTYHFPGWAGLRDVVQEESGDLRAVEGSQADVAIQTDRPLGKGVLVLDDGTRIALQAGQGNWLTGRVPIQKDGMYHVAAVEKNEDVRMSEDFFIEAQKETPPTVKIIRPGRDAKVNPIEEVTIGVQAEDDFALEEVALHYSVNAGPEKVISLLPQKGVKKSDRETLLTLEDFKMVPGDVVSIYATAKDARSVTRSDMAFIEAEPFEREYSQSQESGGGGGGAGEMGDQTKISQRQKEIIAATFNQVRDRTGNKTTASDNAKFLADMQAKLRDQSNSLARRMESRQLSGNNQEFQSFAKDMQQAGEAMGTAVEKLKGQSFNDALPPEQKALQYICGPRPPSGRFKSHSAARAAVEAAAGERRATWRISSTWSWTRRRISMRPASRQAAPNRNPRK
jgi:hypothetical protein